MSSGKISVYKEPTGIRKTFAETVAAPKVKPVSQEATVPTGGPTVVTNKMDPAHGSSLNKDKEDKVSKMTSDNGNAKSDLLDDRKFLIPCEHIKRNKKKRNPSDHWERCFSWKCNGCTRASSPFICEEDLKRH